MSGGERVITRMRTLTTMTTVALCLAVPGAAQAETALDGPNVLFRDKLVDQLAGRWELEGTMAGRKTRYRVTAGWVLNHQFMRVHLKELGKKDGAYEALGGYEALVFLGHDNTRERHVAHWIDVFGGRASETLGFGKRKGNAITFVFEYPDGPFRTTFRWNPRMRTWQLLMRTRNKAGKWSTFGQAILRRAK